jgi:surface antigen
MKKKILSVLMALVMAVSFIVVPETGVTFENGFIIEAEASNSSFTPRTTRPNNDNRFYIKTTHTNSKGEKGLNECILGNNANDKRPTAGSVLPNCVGYTWGRAYEILGTKPKLSKNNASTFWGTKDGYERGQTPRLGAIACWSGGSSGAGHVAVVEAIHSDGTITLSHSAWSGDVFYTNKRSAKNPSNGSNFKFQGYIYLPISTSNNNPPHSTPTNFTAKLASNPNNIALSWNAVSTASTYQVQWRVPSGTWKDSTDFNKDRTRTSFTITNMPNATYEFRVRALKSGNRENSEWRTITFTRPAHATPTNFKASKGNKNTDIKLSWTAVSTATTYQVQWRRPNGAWADSTDFNKNRTRTSFTITGMSHHTYEFRVRALASNGRLTSGWRTITYKK